MDDLTRFQKEIATLMASLWPPSASEEFARVSRSAAEELARVSRDTADAVRLALASIDGSDSLRQLRAVADGSDSIRRMRESIDSVMVETGTLLSNQLTSMSREMERAFRETSAVSAQMEEAALAFRALGQQSFSASADLIEQFRNAKIPVDIVASKALRREGSIIEEALSSDSLRAVSDAYDKIVLKFETAVRSNAPDPVQTVLSEDAVFGDQRDKSPKTLLARQYARRLFFWLLTLIAGTLVTQIAQVHVFPHIPWLDPASASKPQPTFYSVQRAVHLRAGATTKARILMTLSPKQIVRLLERDSKWIRVEVADHVGGEPVTGWVYKKYLRRIDGSTGTNLNEGRGDRVDD